MQNRKLPDAAAAGLWGASGTWPPRLRIPRSCCVHVTFSQQSSLHRTECVATAKILPRLTNKVHPWHEGGFASGAHHRQAAQLTRGPRFCCACGESEALENASCRPHSYFQTRTYQPSICTSAVTHLWHWSRCPSCRGGRQRRRGGGSSRRSSPAARQRVICAAQHRLFRLLVPSNSQDSSPRAADPSRPACLPRAAHHVRARDGAEEAQGKSAWAGLQLRDGLCACCLGAAAAFSPHDPL